MEVIKFVAATVITEEERRTLGKAIAIMERILVNAVPVVEQLPDTIEAQPCRPEGRELQLNGKSEGDAA